MSPHKTVLCGTLLRPVRKRGHSHLPRCSVGAVNIVPFWETAMLFDAQVLAFCVVAAIATMSPGPDTFLVIRNTLGGGVQGGIATTLGIVAGGSVHALLAAVGLTLILVQSAQAFFWVKLVGALYLVYLGVQSLRSGLMRDAAPPPLEAAPVRS